MTFGSTNGTTGRRQAIMLALIGATLLMAAAWCYVRLADARSTARAAAADLAACRDLTAKVAGLRGRPALAGTRDAAEAELHSRVDAAARAAGFGGGADETDDGSDDDADDANASTKGDPDAAADDEPDDPADDSDAAAADDMDDATAEDDGAVVERVDPERPRRVGDTPYREAATHVRLRRVTLRQFFAFAHALTDPSGAGRAGGGGGAGATGLRLSSVRLSAPRGEEAGDRWNVEAALTSLVYDPKPPAGAAPANRPAGER